MHTKPGHCTPRCWPHEHFWDITAVRTLDKVVLKLRRKGAEVEVEVEVLRLNEASATLIDKFSVHDKRKAYEMPRGY